MNAFIKDTTPDEESKSELKKSKRGGNHRGISDTVHLGEQAELIFATKALVQKDLPISWPQLTMSYDLLLENKDGVIKKIQIKASIQDSWSKKNAPHSTVFNISQMTPGKIKSIYPEDSIDYFALYDVENDVWYNIPRSATTDQVGLRISTLSSGKWEAYKEDWSFK
tara:strand:- start:62 stop:562 length:501 start_codon:yes stop_codon:yes gene_type:complete